MSSNDIKLLLLHKNTWNHFTLWKQMLINRIIRCLNFWDEACWFLSLRVFGLLFSSLLLFPQHFGRYVLWPSSGVCCLNFWDEACWFLSLKVFGLLSSSLLLFPQRFGRYVIQPSSGVCRIREPSNYVLYWNHGGRLFWFR